MSHRVGEPQPRHPAIRPEQPQQPQHPAIIPIAAQAIGNHEVKEKSSFFGKAIHKLVAGGLRLILPNTHQRDENILLSVVGDRARMAQLIAQASPIISHLLPQLLPDFKQYFEDAPETSRDLLDRLFLHLLANFVLAAVPVNLRQSAIDGGVLGAAQLSTEQLMRMITLHLIEKVGSGMDAVDAEVMGGAPLNPQLFAGIANHLIDLALPPDDPYWKLPLINKERVRPKAADALLELYKKIDDALSQKAGELPQVDLEAVKEPLRDFGLVLAQAIGKTSLQRDRDLLKALTGAEDFYALTQKLAPGLSKTLLDFLPPQVKELLKGEPGATQEATEALVMHALSSIVQELFPDAIKHKRVLPVEYVIKQVASHMTGLFKKRFEECDKIREAGGVVDAKDLAPLAADIIKLMLPKRSPAAPQEKHFLQKFIERRQDTLLAPISEMFLKIYESQSDEENIKAYKQRLKAVFSDPRQQVDAAHEEHEADRVNLVEQYFQLCQGFVAMGSGIVKTEFLQDSDWIADQLQQLGGKNAPPLREETLEHLTDGIMGAFQGEDHNISWLGGQCQKAAQSFLFKLLVRWLEKVPLDKRHPPEKLLANALQLILDKGDFRLSFVLEKLQESLKAIDAEVQVDALNEEAAKKSIADKRMEAAKKLMQPFLNDLIAIFFENEAQGETLEEQFPLPEARQKEAAEFVREKALNLFANVLLSSTSWIHERQQNADKLKQLYDSEEPAKFCHTLGEMASHGLPYAFREKNEKIVKKVMDKLSPLLGGEPAPLMEQMVSGFVQHVGTNQSQAMQHAMGFIGSFTETALLKLVAMFSEELEKMDTQTEPGEPSLLEKAAMGLIEKLRQHFSAIVQAKKGLKKSKASEIRRGQLATQFKKFKDKDLEKTHDILHPAAASDAARESFFGDWAKNLFKIVHPSDLDLIKGKTLQLVEKQLLPLLLMEVFDQVKDTHKLNSLLLDLFQQMDALPKAELPHKMIWNLVRNKPLPELHRREYDDAYQKELEMKLGTLSQALVNLQPTLVPQLIMRLKKTRELAGEAIGQALRGGLREGPDKPRPILELLGLGMQKMRASIEQHEWSHHFPRTQAEKRAAAATTAAERKTAEKKLPKVLRKVLMKESEKMLENIAIRALSAIEKFFKKIIGAIFGKYADKVARIIMPLVRFLVELPVYLFLKLLHLIFWIPMKAILTFYIKNQSENRVKDLNLDIHDNLFYHVIGETMGLLAKEA